MSFQASQMWYDASREASLNFPNNDITDLGGNPNDFSDILSLSEITNDAVVNATTLVQLSS